MKHPRSKHPQAARNRARPARATGTGPAEPSAAGRHGAAPAADRDDLVAALAASRAATAELSRALAAHAAETQRLATRLNEHELAPSRTVLGCAEVLNALDRLADDRDTDFDPYRATVRRIADRVVEVLRDNGCEVIGVPGEIADPATHQVIDEPCDSDQPEDTVLTVIRRGLRRHGRLVRPATVTVSSGRPPQPDTPEPAATGSGTHEEQR